LGRDNKYSTHSWCNGEVCNREDGAPSIASVSFHLGTSVFEGMMAYWNRDHYHVLRAEEHLVRFREGAERMGLVFPWSVDELLAGIHELLDHESKSTQYIRPIAYRRAPELWITGSQDCPADVSIFTVRTDGYRDVDEPIACQISPIERISSRSVPGQIKVSGSYVNSFLARRTAELSGFDDGIMLDREGRITEASAANVFVIVGEQLVTPRLNPDLFPGITRRLVLELARINGIEAIERDLRCNDLVGIDGAFVCSTLMEIRGLSRLNDRPLSTLQRPVFKAIVDAFRSVTHQ
jgi:branched-chain amino acid aminotransferase